MQTVTDIEEFSTLQNNRVIGLPKEMISSKFEFNGENNIVFFDENVMLSQTTIRFLGNNNLIFISSSAPYKLKIKLDAYNNSTFYIGKKCNTVKPIHIILSEGKNVIIGNECLFSRNIWFRNADPHLIYDGETKQRINESKSIYLGDHVWIGQDVLVAKGTQIGSGSIIGAKAVTTSRAVESNCSAGGVPCKVLKRNIFWLKDSVHGFLDEDTQNSMVYDNEKYLYHLDQYKVDFGTIETELCNAESAEEKTEVLKKYIFEFKHKNRFYIAPAEKPKKKKSFFKKRK